MPREFIREVEVQFRVMRARILSTIRRRPDQRSGATLVEFAIVMPVFAIFMAGIIEFGHAYLVIGTLNAAARGAARLGAVEDITTAQVETEAKRIIGSAIRNPSAVTIRVKDASVFDQSSTDVATINYGSLPTVEVNDLKAGKLFVVQLEVPYKDVAIMSPFWAKSVTLRSQSVMRHE